MPFTITRGTNLSHWLSQSDRRGPERRAFFTQADVQRLADWGFDHLRLPIDEEQMWNDAGRPEPEAFDLLDAALDWCHHAGLRAVVDLHILRSHYFITKTEPTLFTDPAQGAKFADLWRHLSGHLRHWSNDQLAYELMNEPVATNPDDWNRVAALAWQALREREPQRTIILGSNRWNSVDTFDRLWVPADPRLILTFHYYHPMLITHYQANWWEGGVYTGPVHYPGVQVLPEDLAAAPPEVRTKVEPVNKPYDRTVMAADLAKPLAVAARTGLPLYCGEFGVYQRCPQELRLRWYRDFLAVLKAHSIGWANWDYKGGFGLVTADGNDTGIAPALLA